MKKYLMLTLAAALMSGCASLSEGQCKNGDWYGIGDADGRNGEPERIQQHTEACSKYGVVPNAQVYFAGRQHGLQSYCTPANGYREGRAGREYENVCPASVNQSFVEQYNIGRERRSLENKVSRAEEILHSRRAEIRRLDDLIVKADKEEDRKRIRRDRDDAARSLYELEDNLDRARMELRDFKDTHPEPFGS
ncbi:DUF2799 domain-containing protein [Burkholderiaceae bacterium DAT-1]|nr:DUF2799 domain-containing protein [Burkholderiaceae bacterium DAT-1]